MALRLLEAARRDTNISTWQVRHLEGLFGPEKRKEWFRAPGKGAGDGMPNPC